MLGLMKAVNMMSQALSGKVPCQLAPAICAPLQLQVLYPETFAYICAKLQKQVFETKDKKGNRTEAQPLGSLVPHCRFP
jgi:hypothetical protein